MSARDNWGWKARFGIFIVGNEAVPEAEWWAMAPDGVSVHASRITARAPWAVWTDGGADVLLADDLQRGATQFGAMKLDAIVIGHSSSSIAGGPGWDETVTRKLKHIVAEGTRVTTNGLDCKAAMKAAGIKRPALVFPPWFSRAMVEKGTEYFADGGFEPVGAISTDPGRGWRDVPPDRMYPEGLGFAQDVEALYRQVRTGCPAGADGVLFVGTGLRCVAIVEELEQDLSRPVISANQASLWHCLRLSDIKAPVQGYGSLFDVA